MRTVNLPLALRMCSDRTRPWLPLRYWSVAEHFGHAPEMISAALPPTSDRAGETTRDALTAAVTVSRRAVSRTATFAAVAARYSSDAHVVCGALRPGVVVDVVGLHLDELRARLCVAERCGDVIGGGDPDAADTVVDHPGGAGRRGGRELVVAHPRRRQVDGDDGVADEVRIAAERRQPDGRVVRRLHPGSIETLPRLL